MENENKNKNERIINGHEYGKMRCNGALRVLYFMIHSIVGNYFAFEMD